MTDEEDRAPDAVERALHRSQIFVIRVEAILNCDNFVSVRLQSGDHFAEA